MYFIFGRMRFFHYVLLHDVLLVNVFFNLFSIARRTFSGHDAKKACSNGLIKCNGIYNTTKLLHGNVFNVKF